MSSTLLTDEVTAAIAAFFVGAGPRHTTLTSAFTGRGLSDDPYNPTEGTPNRETRVLAVCRAARRRPGPVADLLLEDLLTALRLHGSFDDEEPVTAQRVRALRPALAARSGRGCQPCREGSRCALSTSRPRPLR